MTKDFRSRRKCKLSILTGCASEHKIERAKNDFKVGQQYVELSAGVNIDQTFKNVIFYLKRLNITTSDCFIHNLHKSYKVEFCITQEVSIFLWLSHFVVRKSQVYLARTLGK